MTDSERTFSSTFTIPAREESLRACSGLRIHPSFPRMAAWAEAARRLMLASLTAVFMLLPGNTLLAQSKAASHAAERYEVDAKRMGVDPNSEDALPRSREFLRIDSTYYVGWFFEGAYKYNHAADYAGYKNAAPPLERALRVLERDYRTQLITRTSDLLTFFNAYKYQLDYTLVAFYLMNCYANTEDPEAVFALLRRVKRWNFQRDFYLDVYNYMAWTVHRNRFYTHDKYSFLGNSIDENEALANRYLDSGLRHIRINVAQNKTIFQPGYEKDDYLAVYHYKSLLNSYALKVDSAEYYFNLMRGTRFFPHNNYATFRAICGDFRSAEKEYSLASTQDAGDKRLQEWVYYTSILYIYRHQPKRGELLLREWIKANGSTPGFGWYNIALARCLFYDGQIEESERHADKAAEFKELHIGTTLGQSHYDFSIQLNKLLTKNAAYEAERFQNADWWYNPNVLCHMAARSGEQYLQQFLIINQFAQNPERDRVIYKLFSTESTVSWDEVWYLIRDFSTRFFLQRFEKELQQDERPRVKKYFRYFIARLHMKQEEYSKAAGELRAVLADQTLDADYEKLFLARVYQALAECADKQDQDSERNEWLYRLYQTYPQLVPFSGLKANMALSVSGEVDQEAVDRLKGCNIRWAQAGATTPQAYIQFGKSSTGKLATYYVVDGAGNYIVPRQTVSYQKPGSFALGLAYRLFGIGGVSDAGNAIAEQ